MMNSTDAIWDAAEKAVMNGDIATLEQLLRDQATLFSGQPPKSSWLGGLAPDYSSMDARTILTREHYFASFDEFGRHLAQAKHLDSVVARFESAVDAVVGGDLELLRQLLQSHPALVRARSPRNHRSTLLHYVGANGVEGWRQRTPANAVAIAGLLLAAGSEVDALAGMYGGSTPLGLVATSVHPLRAGVQNELMEVLLAHGAAVNPPGSAGRGQSIINGCLANGRPGAAAFLAARGAHLDLEGAAGVGRLEVVRGFFEPDGVLKAGATMAQALSGFQWACEYDHLPVVEFLLQQGVDCSQRHRGQTGLHWAAHCGHASVVRLLLQHGAPVHLRDERFGGTPLGWALHGWEHSPDDRTGRDYPAVVASLVAAGAIATRQNIPAEKLEADPRMAAALRGDLPAE